MIVRTEKDTKISSISRRIPKKGEELDKSIILLTDPNQKKTGPFDSLGDYIGGSSMCVVRVFAPEKICNDIGKILDDAFGD